MAKDKTQDALPRLLKRIESAEKWRDSNYRDLWERCYKRYRNKVDPLPKGTDGKPERRSNISIPYTFQQVETILPRLVETLFASRPFVSVLGREVSDELNAGNMETLLDWQMNERMDLQGKFLGGLKGMCIYGTTVSFTGWRLNERKVIKRQLAPVMLPGEDGAEPTPLYDTGPEGAPLLDDGGQPVPIYDWQQGESTEKVYDDPEVHFLDLGLFYVDPNAEEIDDARYCGHITYESRETLQQMAGAGTIKLNWKKIAKESHKNEARARRMSQVGLSDDESACNDDEDTLYEVHHYWEDNRYAVIINRSFVARDGENPYWHRRKPYCKDCYTPIPGEFYGMGVVEMLEDLQDELNTERNQRIDFRSFLLRRMFKVRRGSNVNPNTLVWRQGGVVPVDDMKDVEEIGLQDIPASSFPQEQTIKQDMQDTSGAHDVVMGTSGSSETATSTMSKDNNASMRFKLVISSIEKTLLCGIARMMMQLNQQFVDGQRVMRVAGADGERWVRMSPEDIQGEFDLIAAGSSVEPMANKEAFKQRMVQLYGMVVNDPFMQQYPDKRRNLLKKVYEAFDIKNTDGLLPTDEELSGMQQQQIIGQFMQSLPPEIQQLIMAIQQPAGPPQDLGPPDSQPAEQMPSGANTAPQVEPALAQIGGGAT